MATPFRKDGQGQLTSRWGIPENGSVPWHLPHSIRGPLLGVSSIIAMRLKPLRTEPVGSTSLCQVPSRVWMLSQLLRRSLLERGSDRRNRCPNPRAQPGPQEDRPGEHLGLSQKQQWWSQWRLQGAVEALVGTTLPSPQGTWVSPRNTKLWSHNKSVLGGLT